jgi:hypothetical protein
MKETYWRIIPENAIMECSIIQVSAGLQGIVTHLLKPLKVVGGCSSRNHVRSLFIVCYCLLFMQSVFILIFSLKMINVVFSCLKNGQVHFKIFSIRISV